MFLITFGPQRFAHRLMEASRNFKNGIEFFKKTYFIGGLVAYCDLLVQAFRIKRISKLFHVYVKLKCL